MLYGGRLTLICVCLKYSAVLRTSIRNHYHDMNKNRFSIVLSLFIFFAAWPVWATSTLPDDITDNTKVGVDFGIGLNAPCFVPKQLIRKSVPFDGFNVLASPNTSLGLTLGYNFPGTRISPELGINYGFTRILGASYLSEKIVYEERYLQIPTAVKFGTNQEASSVNISGYLGYEFDILLSHNYDNNVPQRLLEIKNHLQEDPLYIQKVIDKYPALVEEVIKHYPGDIDKSIVRRGVNDPEVVEKMLKDNPKLVERVIEEASSINKQINEYNEKIKNAVNSLPRLSGSILLGGIFDLPKGFYIGIRLKIPVEILSFDFGGLGKKSSFDGLLDKNKNLVRIANQSLLEFNLGVDIMKWL